MNNLLLTIAASTALFFSYAQSGNKQEVLPGNETIEATHFSITKPLRDIEPYVEELLEDGKIYTVNNKLRRYKHINPNALPKGNDPLWQKSKA